MTSETIPLALHYQVWAGNVLGLSGFSRLPPNAVGTILLKIRIMQNVCYHGQSIISKHFIIDFAGYSLFRKELMAHYLGYFGSVHSAPYHKVFSCL